MKKIKSKDTKIEILLRQEIWNRGMRYRKNYSGVFGKPDIVFIRKKIAVFCDSEFWHGYNWEVAKTNIKTNRDFWYAKIEANIERDKIVNEKLKNEGWIVLRFSDKEIIKNISNCADIIERLVRENEKS